LASHNLFFIERGRLRSISISRVWPLWWPVVLLAHQIIEVLSTLRQRRDSPRSPSALSVGHLDGHLALGRISVWQYPFQEHAQFGLGPPIQLAEIPQDRREVFVKGISLDL